LWWRKKIEPNYFKDLRRIRGLTATLVLEAVAEDPTQLVERAIAKISSAGDFDAAYVVFDRDSFEDFAHAIDIANAFRSNQQPDLRLIPIPSGPCFEVWLLLHFVDTDKKFVRTGTKSPGQCVESELKKYFPLYQKSDTSLFLKISTHERLKLANERSHRLRKACDDILSCTFTDVDVLVGALQNPDATA
jgi:RloB-like protein